ncbi:hypothetical protein HPP92_029175 [Vanilla planifolia]|uniref:Uncharacterized protein n=1 Tax=Vanilla planifolia TaxID=51239 RepID=A0A835P3B4_VANPL|nr:hypothetical protein HPP92_029175 [Vanilla planifolia]KAG0445772.1 hypothetical protein HPP92_029162 [Vanilla planifolia]
MGAHGGEMEFLMWTMGTFDPCVAWLLPCLPRDREDFPLLNQIDNALMGIFWNEPVLLQPQALSKQAVEHGCTA